MDAATIKTLIELNNTFYRKNGASFSKTRERAWDGWQKVLDTIVNNGLDNLLVGDWHHNVFDLACGNMRFEAFLNRVAPENSFTFYAVDNCDEFTKHVHAPEPFYVYYQHLDILDALQQNLALSDLIEAPAMADLSVSFGFMHHVPTQTCRRQVLHALIEQTRPGGYVAVSFWQFAKNEAMREKAEATTTEVLTRVTGLEPATLDANDYLLGWQNKPAAYRYCHSFSETEIDELVTAVSGTATVIDRFTADGRTGNLNAYLVLQVD